jgi:heme/copper-type cytochrome/quinol oxidase subunit 3
VSELAHPATDYEIVEGEPHELLKRNLSSAAHLLASATAFFFIAFVFAYFYLRSLNNAGLWHPKHVDAPQALGAVVIVLTVLSALAVRWAVPDARAVESDPRARTAWRNKCLAGLGLGLVSLVLQVVAWTSADFGPADGGYASVYFGWTAFFFLFVLGTLYWLETLVATGYRYRNLESHADLTPGHASGDPHREGHDIAEPLWGVVHGVEAASFYWSFLAGVGVVTWIILYLV